MIKRKGENMTRSSKTRFGIVAVLGIGFVLGLFAARSDTNLSESVEAAQARDEKQDE